MQIHELNNFTGTLGSGAYLAIDDGTDTGKISSQGLLAATEARIDNIIAGPAPSAEEIVDARLGADGVTYPSLGDAIRDQITDVKSVINNRQIKAYMTCTTKANGNYPYVDVIEPIKKGDVVKIAYTSYGGQNLDHAFAAVIRMDNTRGNIKDPLTINEEYAFVAQNNYKGVRFVFKVTSAESGDECGIEFINVTRNQQYTRGAKKNIIFIGDSYTEGYSPDGSQTAFPKIVQQYYGLMDGVTYHRYYKGGTGFGRVVDDVDFNVLLDRAIADDTVDKNEVTDIIVVGGYNDGFVLDQAAITSGLDTFSAKVKQYFPNAKFSLSYVGWGTGHAKYYNHMICRNLYKNIVLQNENNVYLDGLDVVLHNYNYFASDGVHPNQCGHNEIAKSLINYLRGTPSFNIGTWLNTTVTPETGYSFSDATIHGYISGENIICTWLNNQITFSAASLSLSNSAITIGSLSGGVLHGGDNFGTTQAPFVGFVVHTDGAHYKKVVGTIIFEKGQAKLLIPEINDNGTGWLTLNNVTGIKFITPVKFIASVFG